MLIARLCEKKKAPIGLDTRGFVFGQIGSAVVRIYSIA